MSNEQEKDTLKPEASAEGEAASTGEEKPKPVPKKAVKKSEPAEAGEKPAVAAKADGEASAQKEPVKKEVEPPPPPEPGRYGQLLIANGYSPKALGKDAGGMEMIELQAKELQDACRFLRDSDASRFDLLVSVSGVDWKDRLEVVYHLYSTHTFERLCLKATAIDGKLPSLMPVWHGADWHERETYDLFGIIFEGHPNLTRILMPSDWIGHPLRKDYVVEDPRLVWNER